MKIKNIRASFERTLTYLIVCSIVPKFKSPIITECSLYKGFRDPGTERDVGYCHHDFQTKCIGKIQFCGNPHALKGYLIKQGLGWEEKKRDDYRHPRKHVCGSKARTFPGSVVAHNDSALKEGTDAFP
jgi:hypothetical protein